MHSKKHIALMHVAQAAGIVASHLKDVVEVAEVSTYLAVHTCTKAKA